jgi:catechol 2,3-dioxygenase-like lactoylglutathione lyase family enzyme
MSEGGNFYQITPFIHVPNLDAAVTFFEDLGFKASFRQSNYAYVQRERVAVRLLENKIAADNRGYAYYVDVRDVDALYAEFAPVLAAKPHYLGFGLENQDYGQREFGLKAPDGNLLVFGQGIKS